MIMEQLLKQIEQAECITIFRHEHPDCDALGSQFGLKTWIESNFPEKKVYALGNETCDQRPFPALDSVEDDVIRNSLAIVLDTADTKRIDDQRVLTAKMMVKVDHHPNKEIYGDLQFVNEKAAATCEILAVFFESCENNVVTKQTAEYLYSGLLTDTLCFRTNNTTADTLRAASYLAGKGISILDINRVLFDISLNDFQFASELRSKLLIRDNCIGYMILDKAFLERTGKSGSEARNFINEIGNVKEFQAWAMFTENEHGTYDGSLRSKKIAVNDIAAVYGGGGHRNAAGVKNLTSDHLEDILNQMNLRISIEE